LPIYCLELLLRDTCSLGEFCQVSPGGRLVVVIIPKYDDRSPERFGCSSIPGLPLVGPVKDPIGIILKKPDAAVAGRIARHCILVQANSHGGMDVDVPGH